ncbi:MAG: hypothetical protein ACWGON_03645 [Gemmatimonadota bacterium]
MKVKRIAVAAVAVLFACAEQESPTAPHSTSTVSTTESSASSTASIPISIDVRPFTVADRIPLNAGGVLPVALLGTEDLDVLSVDVTTLAFGPAGGPFTAPIHDLGIEGVLADHLKDLNLDGRLDLVTHYRIVDLGFEDGDEFGCMTGFSLEGLALEGCTEVFTRP